MDILRTLILFVGIWALVTCKKNTPRIEQVSGNNRIMRRVIKDDLLILHQKDVNANLATAKDRSHQFVKKILAVALTLEPKEVQNITLTSESTLGQINSQGKPLLIALQTNLKKLTKVIEYKKLNEILTNWLILAQDKSGDFTNLDSLLTVKDAAKVDKHLNNLLSHKRNANINKEVRGILSQLDFKTGNNTSTTNMYRRYKQSLTNLESPKTSEGQNYRRYLGRGNRHLMSDLVIDTCILVKGYTFGSILTLAQILEVYLLDYLYEQTTIPNLFKTPETRNNFNNIVSKLGDTPEQILKKVDSIVDYFERRNKDENITPFADFLYLLNLKYGDDDRELYFDTMYSHLTIFKDNPYFDLQTPMQEFTKKMLFLMIDNLDQEFRDKIMDILN